MKQFFLTAECSNLPIYLEPIDSPIVVATGNFDFSGCDTEYRLFEVIQSFAESIADDMSIEPDEILDKCKSVYKDKFSNDAEGKEIRLYESDELNLILHYE